MTANEFRPDKLWMERAFDRAAAHYDDAAVLQREVAGRLLERMDWVRLAPGSILDLGAGTGWLTAKLRERYRKAQIVALDRSHAMLRRAQRRASWWRTQPCVRADAEALPFAAERFDLVMSSFLLPWCHDLDRTFDGLARVIRPEGLLMFASVGPDTLIELRESWRAVDEYTHVNAFIDMHDVGDALVRARFADPVLDVERFTLTYPDVLSLMRDLKTMGLSNVTAGRRRGLTGRSALQRLESAYERYRLPDGRYPATIEVVYGHAWRPATLPQRPAADGAVAIPITSLRRRR